MFSSGGKAYRRVNQVYSSTYDALMASGLYQKLVEKKLLVSHEEVDTQNFFEDQACYRVLLPEQVPYISYPYEWSFSQLKSAALLTLKIQAYALEYGFSLKDASAYNVQFLEGRAVFIDTLSFEQYREGKPWDAYQQFCQHFLAPLALSVHKDVALNKASQLYLDGVPLALASKLLPLTTWANYSLLAHIHLHARAQASYAGKTIDAREDTQVGKKRLQALLESLARAVKKLEWKLPNTEWGNYYDDTNYSDEATAEKHRILEHFFTLLKTPVAVVQDLGANNGAFSLLAAKHANLVVSQDIDPVAVERNQRFIQEKDIGNVLPLVQDLSAPSPAIGWANNERCSLTDRGNCDVLLCLALIHHLAISNNVPFETIAKWFAQMTSWLVIEFVPKADSQVERLLATREDIFPNYSIEGFEEEFSRYFDVVEKIDIAGSQRTLYLMKNAD